MRGADEDLTLQPPTKVPQRRPQVSDQDVTQNSDDVSPSNQTSTARSVKTSASVSTEKSKKSYHRKAASHPGAEFVFSDEEDSKGLIKEGRGSFELSGPTTIPPSSTPSPFINYTTEQVGAERVPGLVKNEEETVVSDMPTVSTMTASTLSNLIGPQLVAELAPDEEDVAARVAARITDDIQARLKEEIRAQLQTQDIAQAITVEAESYHGKEKSAATGDGADRDFICGLSQRTFIIVISCIVLFCGVFGGVMAAISGGGGDSANPVELLMGDNMISGTLHADWSESLTNLRTLSLGANSIEGFIPLEWVGFSSLTQLDLQDNHLVGAIPPSLATMSHLMYLFVQNNRLTGTLPSELGDLSELQQCKLQNNPGLNGSVPESFSNLESLTVFLMENTTLTGSIDSLFCNTPNPPTLGADCLGSTPELECTCCEYCCSADGATCEGLTEAPTAVPSVAPTDVPTTSPSAAPTRAPTTSPTRRPTPAPVLHPTDAPVAPVPNPTPAPVAPPTGSPTRRPTPAPVPQPTPAPVAAPTPSPTRRPTRSPTESPTRDPTSSPTRHPTPSPTRSPTKPPTRSPTRSPTRRPTPSPTASPTANPTPGATIIQTIYPFKYTEYKGEITKDQPISVLSSLDLSGTDRGWDYYMEMTAGSDSYWELSFSSKLSVSSGHGLNNIQSISVRMNTIGQAKRHQHRQFYIYNDETSSWTWIGENTEENAWTWLDLTMTVPTSNGGYSDYFNSNNEVEIMIDSDNNDDVSNIDYLAITVHL
eukprot:Nitzschia sp. Nitz4//scaffold187_size43274//298//3240//NITZ4_007327-RA/size43274-processed-gene-0.66-mRNA-1//1//CDS//3329539789//4623//frame0